MLVSAVSWVTSLFMDVNYYVHMGALPAARTPLTFSERNTIDYFIFGFLAKWVKSAPSDLEALRVDVILCVL